MPFEIVYKKVVPRKQVKISTNNNKQIETTERLCYYIWEEKLIVYQKGLGVKMINNSINEKWISIDDAAEYLGVKPVTIRDWIRKGKDIPAHKIGKQWKFKSSELDAWVKSGHSAE